MQLSYERNARLINMERDNWSLIITQQKIGAFTLIVVIARLRISCILLIFHLPEPSTVKSFRIPACYSVYPENSIPWNFEQTQLQIITSHQFPSHSTATASIFPQKTTKRDNCTRELIESPSHHNATLDRTKQEHLARNTTNITNITNFDSQSSYRMNNP